MTAPKRIQQRRTKDWRKPDGAVAVGRGTRWGNPWRAYRGSVIGPSWFAYKTLVMDAPVRTLPTEECAVFSSHSPASSAVAATVEVFRDYCSVMARDRKHEFTAWLYSLRGQDLMCWCPLDQPCHADVLLEIANA